MDHKELNRRLRAATIEWNKRYADRIPTAYPAGSQPHNGVDTDYAEHHAVMSAPDYFLSLLEEEHARILAEYNAPENAAQRRRDHEEMSNGTR